MPHPNPTSPEGPGGRAPGADGPAADGATGERPLPERPAPDHLVVWLEGLGSAGAEPVVHDDELGAGFRHEAWAAELHDGYRAATVAAVYPGHAAPRVDADRSGGTATRTGWLERLDDVVACLRGGSTGFTGDTTPTSLARLRAWTRAALDPDGGARADASGAQLPPGTASEDLVLLVDELASNVERHAPGWLTVDLLLRPAWTTVVVTDPRPWTLPAPGDRDDPADSGRGMVIVAGLSSDWGVVVGPSTKSVWAAVPTSST